MIKIQDIKHGDKVEISINNRCINTIYNPKSAYVKKILPVICVKADNTEEVVVDVSSIRNECISCSLIKINYINWFYSIGGKEYIINGTNGHILCWSVFINGIIQHFPSNSFEMSKSISPTIDGVSCKNCEEFFPMAAANQSDGTMMCYQCKQDKYSRRWYK